jgi:CheY-like chemotaxis protein
VFSPNNTVSELAMILSRTFPRRIVIEVDSDPAAPTVRGSPAQVHQALLNLCVNARDAMTGSGKIVLKTRRVPERDPALPATLEAGAYVAITVADSGPGVPEDLRERIFEPFFSTKAAGAGTGLGLSLVNGIVRNHRGAVTLTDAEGSGAAFTLFLPAHHGEEPTPPTEQRLLIRGSGRVLVVDDEKINRLVLERVLHEAGYAVLSASSGEEALEILQREETPVDLVILDVMMPGLGGEQTLPLILKGFPQTRVIILSGLAPADVPESLRDQDLPFIQKPLEAREILDVVGRLLEERE